MPLDAPVTSARLPMLMVVWVLLSFSVSCRMRVSYSICTTTLPLARPLST
jgi:hypothetical protein